MDKKAFGRNLRRMRLERGLTSKALAKTAKLGRSTVYRYESGETAPKPVTIIRLARALKVEPTDLASTKGNTPRESAHDRDVYKLLNTAQNLDTARLKTLTAFARFLYRQQRQS